MKSFVRHNWRNSWLGRLPLAASVLILSVGACSSGAGPEPDGGFDASPDIVFDGGGGGGSTARPTFAYVVNRNDRVISMFMVDSESGNLSYHGYTVASEIAAFENTVLHPSGDYLYAVSESGIHGFEIDAHSGALTAVNELPGSDFNPRAIVLNAAGTVVYVADRSVDTISVYGIDTSTGVLSSMEAVATGENPVDMAIHPSGTLLYTVDRDDSAISVFPIGEEGSLGTRSPAYTDTSNRLSSIVFSPAGDIAYLTLSEDDRNVKRFEVNTTTGALNFVDTVSAGRQPVDIELDEAGAYAYVANSGNGNVTVFSVATDGALTSIQTIAAGEDPFTIHFGPSGESLYVGNLNSSEVSIYSVADEGLLDLVDEVRTRSGVVGMAFKAGPDTLTYVAENLYVPHSDDSAVYDFDIDSTKGELDAPIMTDAGDRPSQLALHPSGAYAYVINGNSADVYAYSVAAETGELTPNGVSSIGGFENMLLTRLAVDPSGRFLYVLDNRDGIGNLGRIFLYNINANGTLTYNNEVNGTSGIISGGDNPENLIIHPAGRYMYVMNSYGDNVTVFEIAERSGALTRVDSLFGLDRALHAAIHPNGRWIYITVQNENELHKYYLRDDNGFLSSLQASLHQSDPPAETSHVAVHPSGDFVYLTARDNTVSWYTVDRSNGNLTYVDMITVASGPEWITLTPDGLHAYGVSSDGVQRFSIDPTTGAISHDGLTELTNLGTFQRSLTVDRLRQ